MASQDVHFRRAPVVEIIDEIKWDVPSAANPQLAFGNSELENTLLQFGARVFPLGYQKFDRTIPPGFVTPAHTQVVRYWKPDHVDALQENKDQFVTLFALGDGILSAHALPPYETWSTFAPTVEIGLKTIFETRGPSVQNTNINSVKLRYLNAFRDDLTDGKSAIDFLKGVLGFSWGLPEAIDTEVVPEFNQASTSS